MNLRSNEPVSRESIRRMCAVLRHRGPDDQGVHVEGNMGMGMRRLSIIDLDGGKQPIANEDGSIRTVFNGEIYNFPELRSRLERRGHSFATRTDTEVIVHLYEDHGEGFVDHLAGMFAIALWDRGRRTLLLARDRLGIKPLFYSVASGALLFGSEIKAILEENPEREPDLQALHDYLSFNYVPGPRTIFQNIRKLPPGCLLICANGTASVKRYWEVPYPAPRAGSARRAEADYREELHDLLTRTVRQHLISDVPLGVFLSGGVDSSAIVALMSEVSSGPVRTFSIGFRESSYDELSYARAVAKHFGTRHTEMVVEPDAAALLPEMVRLFDEPFADSSAIPVLCVSRLAREQVKVALSGEGGDEAFAGYETYAAFKVAQWYRRLPRLLSTRLIPELVKRLPVSHRKVSFDYKAKRFVASALLPPLEAHYGWKALFTEEAKSFLYAGGSNGHQDPLRLYEEAYAGCSAADPLTRLQHVDLKVYLPDDILVKADRMSMAASLEVRVPFLDHRVVEFAASLPPELKLRGLAKKYLLKRTMAPYLPPGVLRARKRGFNVPIPLWLCRELRPMVHDILGSRSLKESGIFNPGVVSSLIDEHEAMRADHSRSIWGLLIFMLWHAEYMRPPQGAWQEGVSACSNGATS